MVDYHDHEWGTPVHDDRVLFEFLVLEGAQAGLSWSTILKKRAAYREAFRGFDPQVVARFETPFKREDPGALAEVAPVAPEPGRVAASVITVQPGYTLWGIATDRYGSGFDYVQIFEANRSQIRDPDLIYPGQVFDLPDAPAAAAAE